MNIDLNKINNPIFLENLTKEELNKLLEEAKKDEGIPFEIIKKYYKDKYK